MADFFRIQGGHELTGTVKPMGNKNAALPILAAALLTDDVITVGNIPDIGDVHTKLSLLNELGVVTTFTDNTVKLNASGVHETNVDAEIASQIRTSVLLAGPLLARFGHAEIARPGGDRIGRRRLDTHLIALEALGAKITIERDKYVLTTTHLRGCDIFLDEMSVTGTEQAILASVLAEGHTTISNAAMEPHIQDLCHCLNSMGARISGVGTHDLKVDGVKSLHGSSFEIGPDYMEVGSLIGLAAATHSSLTIKNCRPIEHRMTAIMYGRLGIEWESDDKDIFVPAEQSMKVRQDFDGAVPKIDDSPWPGFPPDLVSIATVLATQCQGTTLIHQKMFDRRLVFTDWLIEMGAGIVLCDPHRALIMGAAKLRGVRLVSPDIRAGMALVIAALAAEGESIIQNIVQIDRGYENLEGKLRSLGAHIERKSE